MGRANAKMIMMVRFVRKTRANVGREILAASRAAAASTGPWSPGGGVASGSAAGTGVHRAPRQSPSGESPAIQTNSKATMQPVASATKASRATLNSGGDNR